MGFAIKGKGNSWMVNKYSVCFWLALLADAGDAVATPLAKRWLRQQRPPVVVLVSLSIRNEEARQEAAPSVASETRHI